MPKIDATHMPNMWNLGNFALALLLAFRLRAAYERWWLARTAFEARVAGLVGRAAHAHAVATLARGLSSH